MRTNFTALAITLSFYVALPSHAWGPKTQESIVRTSALFFSQDAKTPLRNLLSYVLEGSLVSPKKLGAVCPDFQTNPVAAIKREIHLLQAVRAERIDPYYVYRLGVLGQLVADTTAPMGTLNPLYRGQYFADVDASVGRAQLTAQPRRIVDPHAYFGRLRGQIRDQENTIIREYQAGQGFAGLASAALSSDVSRSVNAVLDVWNTVLTRDV
ncbi:MAG: hypothetical protein QGG73_13070, partial [Candidatus Hydrogenedentes bacterium]|nr:hypothetical protein [Candidatus Hydrogenedentota bacterium]